MRISINKQMKLKKLILNRDETKRKINNWVFF